jgi:hypothetical protein
MGILFQNGLGIGTVPSGGSGGSGYWNLLTGQPGYSPAANDGDLTFPNHITSSGLSDLSLVVIPNGCIYINQFDNSTTDQTTLLSSLIGNSGTIQFSQGGNSITFNFQSNTFSSFDFGMNQNNHVSYYWDAYQGGPNGNSPATLTFNSSVGNTTFTDGPVQITISI